ncbi:MAG: serine/threonine protein kinase [Isosphaeraceae bacterium]
MSSSGVLRYSARHPEMVRLHGDGSPTVIDIGTTLNERFLLEKELGHGGMGAVYQATDQVLQRSVAIKVLKERSGEEVGKKLRLEAQIAARLLHENVVRIYDFNMADQTYYLVMEEVKGTSYARRWRHVPLEDRLRILAQVADALDYAHHQGVVHRDVKPGNVLLTATDSPKLSDFGLSILAEEGDNSGVVRGTPLYMSPEQTKGSRLDYRTDLYSLGVMIYESAVGSAPFTGTSLSIMAQHGASEPDPPRGRNPWVSEDLEALILSLLAKKPEARPRSGAVVAESLRREVDRIIRERQTATTGTGGSQTKPASLNATAPVSTERQPSAGPTPEPVAGNGRGVGTSAKPPSAVPSTAQSEIPATPHTVTAPGDLTTPGKSVGLSTEVASGSSSRAALGPSSAVISVASSGGLTAMVRSPLVRKMLELVLADPIQLTPQERYLDGHYLAYLLSGSKRQGLLLRRPLEPRNADRARLLLGLTYAMLAGSTEEAIKDAASLLDERIEVRATLSPIIVSKYLACRETPKKRKLLRQTRRAIGEVSVYAPKHMIDAKGVLNPGLIPQRLEDLNHIAPPRDEVDDVLVERWNRVAEVWRNEPDFRNAVLRYATSKSHRDPASSALWPEVVYPLIERARWHRRIRSRTEAVWDYLCAKVIRVPDAGVVLDRAMVRAVPSPLVAQLDDSMDLLIESPQFDDDAPDPFAAADEADRLTTSLTGSEVSLAEIAAESADSDKGKDLVYLVEPDPLRFIQGQLHELWKEALVALQKQGQARPGTKPATHRYVPIGPYRLAVIPSVRGRAAGQIAIQGMNNKQIEFTTPTVRTKGSAGKPLLAVWVYSDNSLVVAYLDFMNTERYILWHAPKSHQLNFDAPGDLKHEVYSLGMEVPDQVDKVLSRWFKPKKTV